MAKHQKLELTWIGKEKRPRLEPRILLEAPEKSHHAAFRCYSSPAWGRISTINGHLRTVFQGEEFLADRTIRKFRIVALETAHPGFV